MNKIFSATLLSLALVSTAPTSIASDSEGNYAIWGEGGASCFNYTKSRVAEKDADFKAYLRGYLTSFNTVSEDTYSISGNMKLPEMMEWLDKHCEQKKIQSFDHAIQALITEIEDKRFKTPKTTGIVKGWGKN